MNKLVGILGGTFDPIHAAHVAIAEKSMHLLGLDRVYFLVSDVPPHKQKHILTSQFHRYAMVVQAIAHRDTLIPSIMELEQTDTSYTIESLMRFCRFYDYRDDEILFLAGGDSLRDFHLWKDWECLIQQYRFLFVARPGIDLGDGVDKLIAGNMVHDARTKIVRDLPEQIRKQCGATLVDLEMPDISSTKLRHMLKSGQDCTGLMPSPVIGYIKKIKLYGGK